MYVQDCTRSEGWVFEEGVVMCRDWNWIGHGDGKRPLVRCQCRQEDNIKLMDTVWGLCPHLGMVAGVQPFTAEQENSVVLFLKFSACIITHIFSTVFV